MDIPDFEELQWLESHSVLEEDHELQMELPSPPTSPEPDESPESQTMALPPRPSALKPFVDTDSNLKKRTRFDLPECYDLDLDCSHGKRSKSVEEEAPNEEPDGNYEVNESVIPELLLNENESVVDGGRSGAGLNVEKEERVLSRFATEIDGDCVPITGLDGEMVFAKICRYAMDDQEKRKKLHVGEGLLAEPVRVLMQKVEHDVFAKAVQASVEGPTEVVAPKTSIEDEKLWVEKYAPNSFTELLSDEKTNREVLLWLKRWDLCVFGFEIKSTADNVFSALSRHSLGSMHLKRSGKQGNFMNHRENRFAGDLARVNHEVDKENNLNLGAPEVENRTKTSSPPEQKILLLCGPPGLGKTTLAHVAAKHCGYHVVEINASDDRSTSSIETKILDVLQMNSVVAGSKPKCLVIDEIDGALGDGKGAVEVILRLVSAERKSSASKENLDDLSKSGKKVSRKKQRTSQLLRPIICICNDLYAPALRPLRDAAKVHIFIQPSVSRVVNRLKYICNREGVKTSSIALSALANYTGCDIRSCLNTLQFLNKKNEILNVMDVSSQVVGLKDASKSAFDIWKEIFQIRRAKSIRKSTRSSSSANFWFLYSMLSNHGDYDLILDGIHENMLQLQYVDPIMQKTIKCADNLVASDIVHRYIMRTQKMYLQVYQPPIALIIHGLIAQPEKKDIQWPKSFQRSRTTLAGRIDSLQTWHNMIPAYIARHLSTKSFIEDTVSLLLHILSPSTIRPASLHLLSENEKSELWQLVNCMVSYGITYKSSKPVFSVTLRQEEASELNNLSLDPPLLDFVCFKGYNSCHFDLALAVKQVLVHEVEKQRIRQGSLSKLKELNMDENHAVAKMNSQCEPLPMGTDTKRKVLPAANSGLHVLFNSSVAESRGFSTNVAEAKSKGRTKKPSGSLTDFFHRLKKHDHEGSMNDADKIETKDKTSYPFLFKFNEGFTNAVKRPVRVREFLA